ncbi:MAG: response regulator [Methylococcaceae bacterium]|nr:response regulator [Methylococcaceae bacterium]
MMNFYNLPIRIKFKRLIITTISSAVLFITAVFVIIIFNSQSKALDERIKIQAESVIDRARLTAIFFNDKEEMEATLGALKVDKDIVRGIVALEDNPNFGVYKKPENSKNAEDYRYESFFPCLLSRIKPYETPFKYGQDSFDDDTKAGKLILEVDLYNFYAELLSSIALSLLITFVSIFITVKLAGRIISRIIHPILKLAETAKKVASEQDYTTRAEVFELDEVGILAENLNDMMSQIQLRDDSLEEKVLQRTAALEKARDEAEEANHAKSDFIANISHEIRTPMNAILNKNRFALQTELTAKQRDYLTAVESSTILLLNIINDTLDLSKIEAGKFQLDKVEFSLSEMVSKLSMMFTSEISKKNLALILSYPLKLEADIIGDDLRLSQVLINLLGNAIKFTNQGDVVLAIELCEQTERQVTLRFTVSDTGEGISKEYLGKLFDSFTQADISTTRKHGGTGLGLAISQRLVALMGGNIEVESELNKGSRFSFSLSFNKSEKMPLNSLTMYKAAIEKLNILLVNDNQNLQTVFESVFSDLDISLYSATDLDAAMVALEDKSKTYDVFLIDWKLVKIDEAFSQKIFEDFNKLIQIPIIVMATSSEHDEIIEKKYHGLTKHIVNKPVKIEELIAAISIAVNHKTCINTLSFNFDQRQTLAENIGKAHILLVEDNVINQQIACELLEMQGLQVSIANNGKEAVDLVAQNSFDLVLMDIQMPDMDGYQASILIRKDFSKDELPIVAMTAYAMGGDKARCFAAGMNEHIAKPIEPDVFYKVLAKYLHKKQYIDVKQDVVSAKLFPDVEGIDFQEGLLRLRQNQDLYFKLLQMFIKEHEHSIEEIKQKLADGNVNVARIKAHTLKGVAANLGAKALSAAADRIETQIETHKQLQSDEQLAELSGEIIHFINTIQSLSTEKLVDSNDENKNSAELSTLDVLVLKQQLQELEKLVEMHDFSANTKVQSLLEMVIETENIHQDLKVIEEELRRFNFEKVSELIAALIKQLMS